MIKTVFLLTVYRLLTDGWIEMTLVELINKILTYAAEEDSSCLNKDVWLIDVYDDRIDIVPATKGTISIPLEEQ